MGTHGSNAESSKRRRGARIVVCPGRYLERFAIQKGVEIVGEGPVEDIVIVNQISHRGLGYNWDAMVTIDTPFAVIRGLTLVGDMHSFMVVQVRSGEAIIEACDINVRSTSADGIAIARDSNPTIRRCKVHSGFAGILSCDHSHGTVEECFIYENSSGIRVAANCSPMVRGCIIKWNNTGVTVENGGTATLEDCDLAGNRDKAWELGKKCKVTKTRVKE